MECLFPVRLPLNKKWATVPCGKCYPCLQRNAAGWAVRLMAEHREAKTSHFLTLTYSTDHLPFDEQTLQPTLCKCDVQLFLKRLRKKTIYKEKIMYYAVGEYGDQFKRPHYHIIIFNADIPTIEATWKKGHVYYGSVTMNSVFYTLSYILKYREKQNTFRLSSKGLGLAYLTPEKCKWHTDDVLLRYFAPQPGNKKMPLPRYLKNLIYSPGEKELIAENCSDGQLWDNVDKTSLDYIENMDILRKAYPIGYSPKSKQHLTF